MSSICSRSRRASAAPGRSALFTQKTSATSSRPALLACTASPQPGLTTTTVVSVSPATSTSTWPTPTVSTTTKSKPDGVEDPDGLGGGQRQAAEVAPGGHGADEHVVVQGVVAHPDAVAEDGTAGEGRGRVDGEDGDAVPVGPDGAHQGGGQRGLARTGRPRHADRVRRVADLVGQTPDLPGGVTAPLDDRQQAGQRRAVTALSARQQGVDVRHTLRLRSGAEPPEVTA